MATPTPVERFARCGTCGDVLHPYLFPYKNPDATLPDPVRRTIKPEPAATYEKRVAAAERARAAKVAELTARREAAKLDGRDTSKCLLCLSSEGSDC